jgi:putative hemolysin
MNSIDWIALSAIFATLIIIGFLSGLEIAFVSANKLSIELNKKKGLNSGKIWSSFADHPTKFIGTVLVGVNIVLVIYGLLIGGMLTPIWKYIEGLLPHAAANYVKYIRLFVETFFATAFILLVEFSSKAFFRARNNSILSSGVITYIASFFYWLFSSIAAFFVGLAEWILKYIFNVKINKKKVVFSKIDLEHFIQQSKNHDEEETSELNKELFENALSLGDIKIRECLIPRKEIEAIQNSSSIEAIKNKFIESKLSKLVVYENNIDNIMGYVHHLDMFKNPGTLKEILHPIPTVPESMSATDLMNKFSKERKSIAWVIDEFGGTAGIVTMEDLLEEIFGEIEDEYDVAESFVDRQIAQNEYIFSGRMELDFLTEKYKLQFSGNDEAETLSGYIIQNNQAIPRQKERIFIGNYEFDILNVSNTRIETVKVKVLK